MLSVVSSLLVDEPISGRRGARHRGTKPCPATNRRDRRTSGTGEAGRTASRMKAESRNCGLLTQRNVLRKRVTQVAHMRDVEGWDLSALNLEGEFDAFFRDQVARLVGQGYVFTGDLAQAQDLAHEALARAWERWSEIRLLDDASAWTRKVLYNLAVSEWRRAKVRSDVGITLHTVEGPDVEAMALAEALRTLPELQRHAIVLHDAAGVTVPEIARQLDVPEGTIRSWLTRGRAALAARLRLDNEGETHASGLTSSTAGRTPSRNRFGYSSEVSSSMARPRSTSRSPKMSAAGPTQRPPPRHHPRSSPRFKTPRRRPELMAAASDEGIGVHLSQWWRSPPPLSP